MFLYSLCCQVNTVILCAGQEPLKTLLKPLSETGKGVSPKVFMIGGALEAGELDAKRAIDQGTRLAACLETANSGDVFNAPTTKGLLLDSVDYVKGLLGK